MASKKAHFSPKLFKFLKELRKNNDREWFRENKDRYECDARNPLLEFIGDFGPILNKISPNFVADPRPTGGSMFRIYRDVRFAKDKSPYKTHAAAQFRHKMGRNVHAPGFYLHLEPGQVFAGAGLWRPDPKSLAKIRDAIVDNPKAWKRVKSNKTFKAVCNLGGESLKRPPKGYDPNHPLIEDLKRKDFVVSTEFTEKAATSPGFIEKYAEVCRAAAPFMKFLTLAIELEW